MAPQREKLLCDPYLTVAEVETLLAKRAKNPARRQAKRRPRPALDPPERNYLPARKPRSTVSYRDRGA